MPVKSKGSPVRGARKNVTAELSSENYERLAARAAAIDLPISTMARVLLVKALAEGME